MTVSPGKPSARIRKIADEIRDCALAYPETREDLPWGHSAFKVKEKVFVFMSADDTGLSVGMKLKDSHLGALEMPFTEPTHYGLGKHGWVTALFAPNDQIPVGMLEQWIDESFRLVAPKKLLKELAGDAAPAPAKTAAKAAAKPTARAKKKKIKAARR